MRCQNFFLTTHQEFFSVFGVETVAQLAAQLAMLVCILLVCSVMIVFAAPFTPPPPLRVPQSYNDGTVCVSYFHDVCLLHVMLNDY